MTSIQLIHPWVFTRVWNFIYLIGGLPVWFRTDVADGQRSFLLRPAVVVLQVLFWIVLVRSGGLVAYVLLYLRLKRDDDFSGSLLDVLLAASIENGYSSMDAWVTTVMPYFGDACALIAFAHMIRRREQMQDLANRTLGYFGRCDVVGEGKETARAVKDALLTTLKSVRSCVLMALASFALNLVTNKFSLSSTYEETGGGLEGEWAWFVAVVSAVSFIVGIYSPMHVGTDYVVWSQMNLYLKMLEVWRKNFQIATDEESSLVPLDQIADLAVSHEGKEENGSISDIKIWPRSLRTRVAPASAGDQLEQKDKGNLSDGVDRCLSLYSLLEDMSWLQGPLLLAQFGGCLVQGSACAYCGASIIFAFRGDTEADVYLTRALYSLTFILSVALMGLRVFYSCRVGQSIEDELQNCKQAIEDRHKRFLGCSGRPDSVSFKCHVAVRRLGLPGPIAPGDYFAVNNAAFMSTAAAVCTYLIVLMQFKTTIN